MMHKTKERKNAAERKSASRSHQKEKERHANQQRIINIRNCQNEEQKEKERQANQQRKIYIKSQEDEESRKIREEKTDFISLN